MNELVKTYWQYSIVHKSKEDFEIGEQVFLKSNPNTPLLVIAFSRYRNEVLCLVRIDGTTMECGFRPENLCKYQNAGLLTSKDNRFTISLN